MPMGLAKFVKNIIKFFFNLWQRTKINFSFTSWSELLQGVPQGSFLGLILFSIYVNDLIYFLDCVTFVTLVMIKRLNVCNSDLVFVFEKLEEYFALAIVV